MNFSHNKTPIFFNGQIQPKYIAEQKNRMTTVLRSFSVAFVYNVYVLLLLLATANKRNIKMD